MAEAAVPTAAVDPEKDPLGAFCKHSAVHVPGKPGGPLDGLTLAVKDLYDIAGHPTGCGNPTWLETHPVPTKTAPSVQVLIDAGASVVGKTLTDELAYSINGENAHYGTPLNTKAPDRIPGGSSNGSASAVAGGAVDVALGSDTGGSVRAPASYCGIWGMRTTHGRIPLDNIMPLAPGFDTVGWFTRTAALHAKVGAVYFPGMAGQGGLPSRILVPRDAWALASDATNAEMARHRDRVTDILAPAQGSEVVTLAEGRLGDWMPVFRTLQQGEIWAVHGAWITQAQPSFGPGVRERFQAASKVTAAEIATARQAQARITARLRHLLGGDTVLCLPTMPQPAPFKNTPTPELEEYRGRALSMTCIAGLAGLPQISMPLGTVDGAPVGLSLIGRRGADEMLMRCAVAVEEAYG